MSPLPFSTLVITEFQTSFHGCTVCCCFWLLHVDTPFNLKTDKLHSVIQKSVPQHQRLASQQLWFISNTLETNLLTRSQAACYSQCYTSFWLTYVCPVIIKPKIIRLCYNQRYQFCWLTRLAGQQYSGNAWQAAGYSQRYLFCWLIQG